ncbi:MAG TPA: GNAT family N-acetyltransferase [Anaerolineales bacterium]|nr:GNAT family N-acetyltransferase [Anaerolineae bacterium]HRJ56499.1 GNAT family N-acetyltransferase [Anaerolineales bacterium]HRK87763.1 GNAT family N-acetyltransferase [Anaerolineales bacterium]
MHTLEYRINRQIRVEQFVDLLQRSTLAARRPLESAERVQRMLDNANLTVTAWDGDKLVGVARASTDFAFYCYLSDLAVDETYQHSGIGKMLITLTRIVAGDEASLILLSAPTAMEYYPKVGFEKLENAFAIKRER